MIFATLQQAMIYSTEQVLVLQIFYAIGMLAALLLLVQIGLFFLDSTVITTSTRRILTAKSASCRSAASSDFLSASAGPA